MKIATIISSKKILIAVFLLAFFLRFYKLGTVPAGFFFDEVTLGVNSYNLSNNLHDEFGNFMPDFIRIGNTSDNDFRHGLIFYVTAGFVKAFGLNEFSVRASSAIFGVLMVPIVFWLSDLLFKDKKLALIASLLVAISPWQINLSRNGMEIIPSLFFLTLSDLLFLRAVEKGGKINFLFAYLAMIGTWFSYIGVVPISLIHYLVIAVFAIFKSQKVFIKKAAVITFICFIIFPNAYYWIFQHDKVAGRFNAVSVFTEKGTQLTLNEAIREDGLSSSTASVILTRVFHNKFNNFSIVIFNNYLQYFSPEFLFGQNTLPLRYKIPDIGLIFYIDLPFILFGLFSIFKKLTWQNLFVVITLLVGPVAASLTVEDIPDIQRAIFMNPALQIITAIGLIQFFRLKINKKIKYLFLLATIFLYSYYFIFFLHQFMVHQPNHRNWLRNSEWKDGIAQIEKLQSNYSQIITTKDGTEPYYYLAFFSPSFRQSVNTKEYLANRNFKNTWSLGKFTFVHSDCVIPSLDEAKLKTLYINGQVCDIPSWMRVLAQAKTSDGVAKLTFADVPLSPDQLQALRKTEQAQKLLESTK